MSKDFNDFRSSITDETIKKMIKPKQKVVSFDQDGINEYSKFMFDCNIEATLGLIEAYHNWLNAD